MRLSSALLLALLVVAVSGGFRSRLTHRLGPGHLRPGHRLGHHRPGHGLVHRRPGHVFVHRRPGHVSGHHRPSHVSGHHRPGHVTGHHQPGHVTGHHQPGHVTGHHQPGHVTGHHLPGHVTGHHRPGHGLVHHRPGHVSASCTFWCKSRTGRFHCCDKRPHQHRPASRHGGRPRPEPTHPDQGPVGRRGSCPPSRPFCPRHKQQFSAPEACKSDYSCGHADKCCYDACLKLKVCKPAVY